MATTTPGPQADAHPGPSSGEPARLFRALRRTWLAGTIILTLGPFAAVVALAPKAGADPGRALATLLFLGSSVHVAATAWFYTLPEIRTHVRAHGGRYLATPVLLVTGSAIIAVAIPYQRLEPALLAFFAWQFFHFQKQNLGMAALAASAQAAGHLSRPERLGIVISGVGGIIALLAHPELLQLSVDLHLRPVFWLGLAIFAAGVATGLAGFLHRTRRTRPPAAFTVVYASSLLFFTPVFVFHNPYAAVAGLTIAHGYQYLLIVGMVSGAPRPGRPGLLGVAIMAAVAVAGGAALNVTSHLHGSLSPSGRALYGAYLGALMAHFVIDAGLWRLRDAFPRRFLTASVPYLLPRR